MAAQVSSRVEEIEKERDRKAAALKPETVSREEKFLLEFRNRKILERITAGYNGIRAKVGNLATGAGFAAGPEYYREDLLDGRLVTATAAQGAVSRSFKIETTWLLRPWKDDRFSLYTGADHRNYSRLEFYGTGPGSKKEGRSSYRLEDTNWDGAAQSRYGPLRLGAGFGYSRVNVGRGTRHGVISAERLYSPEQAPGIDDQTDFVRTTVLAQFDYRDSASGPKGGGNYVIQHTWYSDRLLDRYSFRRTDAQVDQYVPLFNKTRVLALRARAILTETDAGQTTPFYYRPFLGGSDDLRGYRSYRFTGPQMLNLNAEYRWEVFAGLDGALFWDGGKVAERRGQINFARLEHSAGFGFRFNVKNATFLRFDVGFSREGFQLWLKFNDAFQPKQFGASLRQPAY